MWLDDLGVVGASTWCLTLVHGVWVETVLEVAGAPRVRDGSLSDAERVNTIAVRPIGAGWVLAVEFNGWLGFVGRQDDFLVELSAGGAVACAAWCTVNSEGVTYVPDPETVVRYQPTRAHVEGVDSPALHTRLTEAGLLTDNDTSRGERIAGAVTAFTGVVLRQDVLVSGGWFVGVGQPDRVLAAQHTSRTDPPATSRWPDPGDLRSDGSL
jgi:hypothetical protein